MTHHHHEDNCMHEPGHHHHEHGHPDNCHHHHHHHAPECDDQLPLLAHVGRGLKGDGFIVRLSDPDDCTQTYLEGLSFDEATKEYHSEWISENINGGELSYQYNLRPFTDPRTFTITFIYRRPGRCEWSWTTPAIPYIWTMSEPGLDSDPDHVVGSGVATLYVRASKKDQWNERLHYPEGTSGKDYNAPAPEEAWSATITFGYGGDIELPNFDDLAKIIGCTKGDIINILEDNSVHWNGIEADNLLDYIDKCDKRDLEHLHKDLGFNKPGHSDTGAFGGEDNVKDYIDKKYGNLYNIIEDMRFNVDVEPVKLSTKLNTSNDNKFQNRTGISYFDKFNGLDLGTVEASYVYSEALHMVVVRVAYKSNSKIPMPFGVGCDEYITVGNVAGKGPGERIRILLDIQAGGAQTIWMHVETNGDLIITGRWDGAKANLFADLYDHVQATGLAHNTTNTTDDNVNVYGNINAPITWDSSNTFSYFYGIDWSKAK